MSRNWKFKKDNKLRGAFGETDFEKKTVRINKKMHKTARKTGKYDVPKKDSTLLNTIVHEKLHTQHPKMTEKSVRKLARAMAGRMTPKQKAKHYNLVK